MYFSLVYDLWRRLLRKIKEKWRGSARNIGCFKLTLFQNAKWNLSYPIASALENCLVDCFVSNLTDNSFLKFFDNNNSGQAIL